MPYFPVLSSITTVEKKIPVPTFAKRLLSGALVFHLVNIPPLKRGCCLEHLSLIWLISHLCTEVVVVVVDVIKQFLLGFSRLPGPAIPTLCLKGGAVAQCGGGIGGILTK